jgi:hypothetical protein
LDGIANKKSISRVVGLGPLGKNPEISCRVIKALLENFDILEEAVWHH